MISTRARRCVWDDPSLGHEGLRDFELQYFLVDDQVVVQEVGPRRDLDQKGPLVKRQRIPKKFDWASQDLRPLAPGSYHLRNVMIVIGTLDWLRFTYVFDHGSLRNIVIILGTLDWLRCTYVFGKRSAQSIKASVPEQVRRHGVPGAG
jgi:hypothetical protein